MPDRVAGHSRVSSKGIQVQLQLGSIIVTVTIAVAVMLHVVHGAAIAFLEAFAEFAAIMLVDRRMLVDLMVVGIGMTAIHVVTTRCFNAFTEALTLWIAVAVRGAIPIAITVLVLILRLRSAILRRVRWWRRFLGGGLDGCRSGHAEGKSRN